MKTLFVLMSLFPILLTGQNSDFYVNKRYAKHFAEGRKTGRAEVAYFATQLNQSDSVWHLKEYLSIGEDRKLNLVHYKEEHYSWDVDLQKWVTPCMRQLGGGLFRHYHTEGENWIRLDSTNQQLEMKRCGWAKSVNIFIKAEKEVYMRKEENKKE